MPICILLHDLLQRSSQLIKDCNPIEVSFHPVEKYKTAFFYLTFIIMTTLNKIYIFYINKDLFSK